MYGCVDDTFVDDYPYFLTFSKKQRNGKVNSYDFKYYHFPYSVNKEEYLDDGLGSSINLLQRTQYMTTFITVFLYFKTKNSFLKLFMSI